ncbi:diacylglycerol kinase family protein [Actinomyces sp.]|uniref:diacylglycerol/lipid kinase family protein n=1 Tax=Actinomyces sp. TaxID=29317 RepID=UPI0026DD8875|nr:diacylglycerol kinase family protein [Actinomyces sp.]MDO4901387.1 diacylglycerol kinase family protein [Actinomyces sp.]
MTAGIDPAPVAAVVINPAKPAATRPVRHVLSHALHQAGYRTVWLETSAQETGAMQARMAVASSARLVVAAGGDGTVRSVAAGVAGTGVDMAIMPLGTANLAARNLGLPLRRYAELAHVAATGRAFPTDLMWVRSEPAGHTGPLPAANLEAPRDFGTASDAGDADIAEPPQGWARPTLGGEHSCLVVTGMGFDAGLVASTRPILKERLSWGAYGLAALENLGHPRMDLVLGVQDATLAAVAQVSDVSAHAASGTAVPDADGDGSGPPGAAREGIDRTIAVVPESPPASSWPVRTERMTARTLLIANGGRLPAGITLLPQARLDDGLVDVAAIDTLHGLWGWASLARQVLPPRPASYSAGRAAQVLLRRGREVTVRLDRATALEIDGDLVAPTRGIRVRVQAGALRVRRPA